MTRADAREQIEDFIDGITGDVEGEVEQNCVDNIDSLLSQIILDLVGELEMEKRGLAQEGDKDEPSPSDYMTYGYNQAVDKLDKCLKKIKEEWQR